MVPPLGPWKLIKLGTFFCVPGCFMVLLKLLGEKIGEKCFLALKMDRNQLLNVKNLPNGRLWQFWGRLAGSFGTPGPDLGPSAHFCGLWPLHMGGGGGGYRQTDKQTHILKVYISMIYFWAFVI